MTSIDKIMQYENGELSEEETIELFQELIDNGLVWSLQGHYGRRAKILIEQGLIIQKSKNFLIQAEQAGRGQPLLDKISTEAKKKGALVL